MRHWMALCLVLTLASFTTACDKNQKAPAPVAEEGDGAATGGQVTTAEEVEKSLVDGCEGTGTLPGAKTAFTANDFKEANRQARCVFNESVKADPNNPNTEAAFFAFLSSFALTVESPQIQYLFEINVAANTVFGTTGDPESLGDQLEAKFPGDGLVLFRNFFKFHEQKGHSINDVVGKAMELFTESFDDWHVLLKAMANDPKFINAKIPANFMKNSTELPYTFTEASYFLVWVDGLRFLGKVFPNYDLGITNSDSFADGTTLAQDMNTDPKLLSLRGDADGADLIPYAELVITAFVRGAGNVKFHPAEAWLLDIEYLKDTLPKDADGQAILGIMASQLKDSLRGGIVFLSEPKLQFGIDLKKLFTQLPNSASLTQLPLKPNGDPNDEFIKEFFKPYIVIRP